MIPAQETLKGRRKFVVRVRPELDKFYASETKFYAWKWKYTSLWHSCAQSPILLIIGPSIQSRGTKEHRAPFAPRTKPQTNEISSRTIVAVCSRPRNTPATWPIVPRFQKHSVVMEPAPNGSIGPHVASIREIVVGGTLGPTARKVAFLARVTHICGMGVGEARERATTERSKSLQTVYKRVSYTIPGVNGREKREPASD